MEQKLNSYKTYKDKGLLVCLGMILAYFLMLLPLCWGQNEKAESETETAGTSEAEFPFAIETNNKFCEGEIAQELRNIQNGSQSIEGAERLFLNASCDYEYEWLERAEQSRNADRYPGKLTEDGTQQEMPTVMIANGSHEAFKDLANVYGLSASTIWKVEDFYGIKEGVILCITIAETSGGKSGAGYGNIGNVGNNDRGDRVSYAFLETSLEKIGMTLTNKNLGKKQTLGCLSNGGSCIEINDNGMRYATSDGSRERNMVACLSKIYGKVNAQTFNIRR